MTRRKNPVFLGGVLVSLWTLFSWSIGAEEVLSEPGLRIQAGGNRRFYTVAADEFHLKNRSGREQFVKISDSRRADFLRQQAGQRSAATGEEASLVLYEKDRERTAAHRYVLSRKVLVCVVSSVVAQALASTINAEASEELAYAPGHYIFALPASGDVLDAVSQLRSLPEVISAEPLLGRQRPRKFIPNDPHFSRQWHLANTGQYSLGQGIDLGVARAWNTYRGRGIKIAIVDDGLEYTHPDLAPNYEARLQYDYRDGDNDPFPGSGDDWHGTAVAGVAAARGNNALGVCGVAFEATLVGVRLIGSDTLTDDQCAAALVHSNQVIQISSNSWGAEDTGESLEGPGILVEMAWEHSVRTGRQGLGTIFVWAAGNGGELQEDANYDGYANSIYTIAVAAVSVDGRRASYSEPGACLVVCAPSDYEEGSDPSIVTTDLTGDEGLNYQGAYDELFDTDYTQLFGGTSAVTPMVAGVAALMLEANPGLGWRDVQEILMRSAGQVNPSDPDWSTNAAGLRFNHKYGAGLANASSAVTMALGWTHLGPQWQLSREQNELQVAVPDNDARGAVCHFMFTNTPGLRVEHGTVTVSINHPRRGDLAITLISPGGTRSRLAGKHLDTHPDYEHWKLMTVFNWGEASTGVWQVQVADLRANYVGTITDLRVDLYGTAATPEAPLRLTALGYEDRQFKLRLAGTPEQSYRIQASADLQGWADLMETNLPSAGTLEILDPQSTGFPQRFYRALKSP